MLMRSSLYAALKADIIACHLAPGAELHEPDIAARYRVSRSPVRDALLRLEAEGLVAIKPRQSYRVSLISLRDGADLFRLRRLLEPEAAIEAARLASDAGFAALDQAVRYDGNSNFVDDNRRFHCALANLAANRRLAAACVDVIEQSDRLVRVSLGQIEGRQPERLIAEHEAIVAALRRRDGRAAAKLLRAHIDAAEARVMAALRKQAVVIE